MAFLSFSISFCLYTAESALITFERWSNTIDSHIRHKLTYTHPLPFSGLAFSLNKLSSVHNLYANEFVCTSLSRYIYRTSRCFTLGSISLNFCTLDLVSTFYYFVPSFSFPLFFHFFRSFFSLNRTGAEAVNEFGADCLIVSYFSRFA